MDERFKNLSQDVKSRISGKVVINSETDCWLWIGNKYVNGYARIWMGNKHVRAHRWIYESTIGPIGELTIDHLCKVKNCINPSHMEPVTVAENNRRSNCASSVNRRKVICKRGHAFDVIITYRSGRKERGCRQCKRILTAKYKEANRLARRAK